MYILCTISYIYIYIHIGARVREELPGRGLVMVEGALRDVDGCVGLLHLRHELVRGVDDDRAEVVLPEHVAPHAASRRRSPEPDDARAVDVVLHAWGEWKRACCKGVPKEFRRFMFENNTDTFKKVLRYSSATYLFSFSRMPYRIPPTRRIWYS